VPAKTNLSTTASTQLHVNFITLAKYCHNIAGNVAVNNSASGLPSFPFVVAQLGGMVVTVCLGGMEGMGPKEEVERRETLDHRDHQECRVRLLKTL